MARLTDRTRNVLTQKLLRYSYSSGSKYQFPSTSCFHISAMKKLDLSFFLSFFVVVAKTNAVLRNQTYILSNFL